jgi:copper chaperone CopZ
MTKKTYKVEGMHCTSCAMVIESDLEDAGVNARCSYAKQTLEAEFDEMKVSEKNIADILKKAGYKISI